MTTKTKVKKAQIPFTYTVFYTEDGVQKGIGCSKFSLTKYIETLSSEGAEDIVAVPNKVVKPKKTINKNIVEIRKYYDSKYTCYYRKLKLNKIDQDTFMNIVKVLKELKSTCKDRLEFEKKFEEYKKSLTVTGK